MTTLYIDSPEVRALGRVAFPNYTGNKFRITAFYPMRLDSCWSGGSRDWFEFVNLATNQTASVAENGTPFSNGGQILKCDSLPVNVALVCHLNIGSTPAGEDCAQVGSDNYHSLARRECQAFINQIRRVVGQEPPGAALVIKSFLHDFGSYLEVCIRYSDADETAADYAFAVENSRIEIWDDEARRELNLQPAQG